MKASSDSCSRGGVPCLIQLPRAQPFSNLFPRPTCSGLSCVLTPSAFVHLSIHEKGGHFVRLQAARLKSELILAGDWLGREKDFGGLLLLASSADSKQLLTTVRPLVLLFFLRIFYEGILTTIRKQSVKFK